MPISVAKMAGGERKIKICDINEMITCKICSGYLIDATTVTECLHTFCKSCIVKHLEDNINCPECEVTIHQSHPLDYIAFDRTMQDIVYKLVPNLETDEYKREREFYAERGLPCPKDMEAETEKDEKMKKEEEDNTPDANTNMDSHRFDEQVSLVLETQNKAKLKELPGKYIRVSCLATINHLKKFIALKCFNTMDGYKDIDITCDGELVPKDHTLKFVQITRWRTKAPPLKLVYSPKINLELADSYPEGGGHLAPGRPKAARHQHQAPQWKLQPKISYDDDEES